MVHARKYIYIYTGKENNLIPKGTSKNQALILQWTTQTKQLGKKNHVNM